MVNNSALTCGGTEWRGDCLPVDQSFTPLRVDDATEVLAALAALKLPRVRLWHFAGLARLIHDLGYRTERGRTYSADLAWWHLARRIAPRASDTTGRTAP